MTTLLYLPRSCLAHREDICGCYLPADIAHPAVQHLTITPWQGSGCPQPRAASDAQHHPSRTCCLQGRKGPNPRNCAARCMLRRPLCLQMHRVLNSGDRVAQHIVCRLSRQAGSARCPRLQVCRGLCPGTKTAYYISVKTQWAGWQMTVHRHDRGPPVQWVISKPARLWSRHMVVDIQVSIQGWRLASVRAVQAAHMQGRTAALSSTLWQIL